MSLIWIDRRAKGVDYSDLCELWDRGVATKEIARRKGVSAPAVSQKARRMGLPPRETFYLPGRRSP
jgi:hypothetical protein